jgi:predicted dehydrogenase
VADRPPGLVGVSRRRLRVGVIGTGLVAQIMHLPYLAELDDLFEVRALCDSSRDIDVVEHCGQRFGVDRLFTNWEQLLEEDLDAVVVLTSGSHAAPAVAAATAGMHVLVEKPMCFSIPEGAGMLAAAARSGVVLMVGYPKRYDPAYCRAREVINHLGDLRFGRVTTLEAPSEPYVAHHHIVRGHDIGADQVAKWRAESDRSIDEAIGPLLDHARITFQTVLLDTMVHEFNLLRGVLGEPTEVRFASLRAATVTVVLDFGGVECVVTWLDLPGIARYEMEACFYDPVGRVRLAFPSPYLKNTPAVLEMTSGDLAGPSSVLTSEVVSYEEPFKLELVEFHRAAISQADPLTSGLDGLRDVALCQAVVASARSGRAVPRPTDLGVRVGGP